jgi:hypothetical protein
MIDYDDPKKWLILQYRPGAGGKFLASCLMTLECVAHWDIRVEHGKMSYQDWVDTQWNYPDTTKWLAFEPLYSWDTIFFSRTFPRGSEINKEQYNDLMNQQSSDYFKQVWASNKLVLDFLVKETAPWWWADAKRFKLNALPNCPIHKKFLIDKLYPYDHTTGIGTSMMDKPMDENKYQNARVYNNQFEFGPFLSEDEWYNYIWKTDFRLNFNIDSPDILLNDLLSWQNLSKFITQAAKDLNTNVNYQDLRYVFDYWMKKNQLTPICIDT